MDSEKADGVTWVVGNGVPKPNLIGWAANETAGYAVDHWEELGEMTPSKRLELLKRSRFASRDTAAVRGTAVHALAQTLAAGEIVDVPEELVGHVDAYLAFADEWAPVELLTEVVCGNRKYRYMGTLDLVAVLNDGKRWLLDWKTSASGIWPESALQLSAYRYAEWYLDGDGVEQPMPEVDACGCVWLRADGYDLVPVDASPETFTTFLYAQQLARFQAMPREAVVGEALRPPEDA